MKYKELSRMRERKPKQVARSATCQRIKALFDKSDNIFDRGGETVLDDEDETEDEDEDKV